MADHALEQLVELFNVRKKRDAESLARKLTVTSEAFANLALRIGALLPQYHYQCHFDEVTPPNLEPTQEELTALGRNGVGLLRGKALKASRKMGQIFRDRRLLCVHLFYAPSHKYWHSLAEVWVKVCKRPAEFPKSVTFVTTAITTASIFEGLSVTPNKQLQRTVKRHSGRAVSAPLHYALAALGKGKRAAAELRR